jgi:hypothetical protein
MCVAAFGRMGLSRIPRETTLLLSMLESAQVMVDSFTLAGPYSLGHHLYPIFLGNCMIIRNFSMKKLWGAHEL